MSDSGQAHSLPANGVELTGLLTYAGAGESHPASDYAYLEVYLAIVESALARVAQFQSLEPLAYQDPMTELANRRAIPFAGPGEDVLKDITAGSICA